MVLTGWVHVLTEIRAVCLLTAVAVSLVGESLEILEGHTEARHRLYFPCILSLPERIAG